MSVIIIFLTPIYTTAEPLNVEIFDVKSEQVLKTVPKTQAMQNEIKHFVDHINDRYQGINPVPKSGYMIKIPLDPHLKVDNEWLTSEIDIVIIIIPEDEKPYLITFDQEDRPRVFLFEANIDDLLNEINFKPCDQ
ncbi:hypothetical protein [Tenuibacillus multivorans]|uniref:Uncharacterized protein n=1 Tax=Tenuibacillus multivorans TaxID=237069 RepID=A0A1H0CMM8_9BACI|nr:hypothetical protein [Tenuibacillus multivorans]GEL76236.1 hypothetical protein TMU01_04710 [Tenuibacillus multivorans]SDN59136.1 hypothetical protein SAMN05216498_2598 [Tenuibacillus multivorans]